MDKELLLKEQELSEINKKINLRTRELFEKIDNIKYADMDAIFRTYSATENRATPKVEDQQRSRSASNPSIARFTAEELKTLNIPEDINNVGSKGFIQFLKSKLKQMQFEADKLNQQYKAKCEEAKALQKDKTKLQEDKEKYLQQANAARCQITKLEAQYTVSQSRLQAKEGENLSLAREIEGLARDLKTTKSSVQHGEVRCQRALEELAKLKLSLRSMQQNEKDMKNEHHKHTKSLNDSLKRLEKQKSELLAGFKRQHALVDNLKQQKLHIEAMKFTEKTEADFIKMLNQGDTL